MRTVIVALIVLVAAGCSGGDGGGAETAARASGDIPAAQPEAADRLVVEVGEQTSEADAQSAEPGAFSDQVVELEPADGIPEPPPAVIKPTSVSIRSIGVGSAAILGVGIEPNGEMEVPPPLDVGWYEYGPTPGSAGSAVLAGHIASDGTDGAFRDLDRVAIDDIVDVAFEDGSTSSFRVTAVEQYEKYSLPFDDVFAEDGEPQLVLITCGGEFDAAARSYEDNVVVYAVPAA